MTSSEQVIAAVNSELYTYHESGLLDTLLMNEWIYDGLITFGFDVMSLYDEILEIKNGVAHAPNNFYSLKYANLCRPKAYYSNCDTKALMSSHVFVEKAVRSHKWDSCSACCKDEEDTYIIENVVFDFGKVEFYYKPFEPLTIVKHVNSTNSNCVSSDCPNLHVQSKWTVSVNNKTLYANFNKGYMHIRYYGLAVDDNGKYMIPDTDKGKLFDYIKKLLIYNSLKRLMYNNDDTNMTAKLQLALIEKNEALRLADGDVSWSAKDDTMYIKAKEYSRRRFINMGGAWLLS